MGSLAVSPILMIENQIRISSRNAYSRDGFSIAADPINPIDAEIVYGQFKKSTYATNPLTPEISNNSKTLISHPNFTMNFLPGSINERNSGKIIFNNFSSSQIPEPVTLPTWPINSTIINNIVEPKVVSALLIDYRLWMIVLGQFDNSLNLTYALQSASVRYTQNGDVQSIEPHEIAIPLNITVGEAPQQAPVLAPVYFNSPSGELKLEQNQVFTYQQNGLIEDDSYGLTKFVLRGTEVDSGIPVKLPAITNNIQARLMSIFIYQNSNGSYEYGIYHSNGIEPNIQINYSYFKDEKYQETIYNNSPNSKIQNLSKLDIDNQMSYPKVVKTETGFELFWAHSRHSVGGADDNDLSSKIFSTKLDTNRKPFLLSQQPEILNLGEFNTARNFALIDYRDNGNFDSGSIYIPVKYVGINVNSGKNVPSFINWRDTTNQDYWNTLPDGNPNQTFLPGFSIKNDQGYQIINPLAVLGTALLQTIDTANNEITYLFKDLDNEDKWYSQTRNLKNNPSLTPLEIAYNTITVPEIVTNISESNQRYQKGVTETVDIRRQIQNATNNYLVLQPGSPSKEVIDVVGELIFNESPGYGTTVTAEIVYNGGLYIDGAFKGPNEAKDHTKVITLYQEDEKEENFIPLKISSNVQTGFTVSSSEFVSRVNNDAKNIPPKGIPGLVGYSSDNLIQVSQLYLPFLNRITAAENGFSGEVTLNFFFTDNNNVGRQSQIIISGFAASQWIIAIVVPFIVLLGGIIFTVVFIFWHQKKKKDMAGALKAGMILTEKLGAKTTPSFPQTNNNLPPIGRTTKMTSQTNAKQSSMQQNKSLTRNSQPKPPVGKTPITPPTSKIQ